MMARRNARAAVAHNTAGWALSQQRGELVAQLGRRLVAAVAVEIALERTVDGAGNVARNRIERLGLATEAFRGSCINEQHIGSTQPALHELHIDWSRAQPALKARRRNSWRIVNEGVAGVLPGAQAAIQQCEGV